MIPNASGNVSTWRRPVRRRGDDRHISLKKPLADIAMSRDDGDTIEFTGKAYMKIYPKQKNQEGQVG